MVELSAVFRYFPYGRFRPTQDEFVKHCFESIAREEVIAIEAPTGIGKTVATLAAALAAREEGQRVLFCTRTHRQADRAIEELKAISRNLRGEGVVGMSLYGKKHLCLDERVMRAEAVEDAMDVCSMLKRRQECEYYLKFHAMRSWLEGARFKSIVSSAEVKSFAMRHRICPYELAMLTSGKCDVIALTYAYVFDEKSAGAFMGKAGIELSDCVLLIDEAHNLPDVLTRFATAVLYYRDVREAAEEAMLQRDPVLRSACIRLMDLMKDVEGEAVLDGTRILDAIEDVAGGCLHLAQRAEKLAEEVRLARLRRGEAPRSWLASVAGYLRRVVATSGMEEFAHIARSRRYLKVVPLSPSVLSYRLSESASAVLFSGTMRSAGLEELLDIEMRKVSLGCPYEREYYIALVQYGATTAEPARSGETYRKLASRCLEAVRATPGNAAIFAASFEVLEGMLREGLRKEIEAMGRRCFIERREMRSEQHYKMLQEFKGGENNVLLAVAGGRSSEGVDFPGKQLLTAVVAGVPYAEPSLELEMQEKYLRRRHRNAYDLVYAAPAVQKAVHSMTRPIRSLRDVAAMVLIDRRFRKLRRFMPSWIDSSLRAVPDEEGAIERELALFYALAPCSL